MSATADEPRPGDASGIDLEHLTRRLVAAISPATSDACAGVGWLWPLLLRRLAHARPVTLAELARDSGRTHAEVRAALGELADTEYDEAGAVVGHGITLRPTPHQFTVDGRLLYTWCALDTLIFPAILNRPAHVASPAPGSGELIHLRVDPGVGVTALTPASAVVTVLLPEQGSGVRSTFCNHVHFYPDLAAAQGWLTDHPGGAVLSVAQAAHLGHRLAQGLTRQRGDQHRENHAT
jgi:alkylmercury lyase